MITYLDRFLGFVFSRFRSCFSMKSDLQNDRKNVSEMVQKMVQKMAQKMSQKLNLDPMILAKKASLNEPEASLSKIESVTARCR